MKAIIVDLDGTLCNVEHRVHFVKHNPKKWHDFNSGIPDDDINQWCHELIKAMKAQGYGILFVTGRGEDNRLSTENWLSKFNVVYDELFMRNLHDQREDADVKEEIFRKVIQPKYEILLVVDDRASVVTRWRELGLVCLQCDVGDF